jgi:uncharacterized PurR-regulated membrane protein YhhQ (DUF165 family)
LAPLHTNHPEEEAMNGKAAVALTIYIAAIVGANVATAYWGVVPVGFGLMVTAGTYFAGFALLARDFVQRFGGIAWVLVGILVGGVLSWWLATPQLALASCAAFLAAELVDLLVFTRLQQKGFIRAAAISNLISAPIDTFVFLGIAGFPITALLVVGQLVGKLLWATAVPLALYWLGRRTLTHPVEAARV